jgi:hypothetical protein
LLCALLLWHQPLHFCNLLSFPHCFLYSSIEITICVLIPKMFYFPVP